MYITFVSFQHEKQYGVTASHCNFFVFKSDQKVKQRPRNAASRGEAHSPLWLSSTVGEVLIQPVPSLTPGARSQVLYPRKAPFPQVDKFSQKTFLGGKSELGNIPKFSTLPQRMKNEEEGRSPSLCHLLVL